MKSVNTIVILLLLLLVLSCNNAKNDESDNSDNSTVIEQNSNENVSESSSNMSSNESNSESSSSVDENQSDYVKIVNDCGDKIDFAVDPSGVQNNSLSGGSSTEISMKPGDKVRLINGGVIYTHTAGSKGPVYLCK